ncbi:MAG: gephyrin-like molybdotransferase Glp [Myxococcota bacterium]
MISLLQARTLALASVSAGPIVRVPLLDARGLFLAETIHAPRDMPAYDSSATDGFAVQAQDTRGAKRDSLRWLKIIGSVFAGAPVPDRDLQAGEAYRIFAGAPIPYGADAVLRQELARDDGQKAAVFAEVEPGENVRRRGEELTERQVVFAAGHRLDARSVGVLASMGLAAARVRPSPRVAIIVVGEEWFAPGTPVLSHQTYDGIGPLLAALCADGGAEVLAIERSADRDEEIERALGRHLSRADLLLTAGGASARVKHVLASRGATLGFEGVALTPGKSASLALWNGVPICLLPASPAAAAVAFDQLARPMLLARQGVLEKRRVERVRLDAKHRKHPEVLHLLSAHLDRRPDGSWARVRTSGAGQLLHHVGSDGWVVLPVGKAELAAGEEVDLELFASPSYRPLFARDNPEETTR